MLAFICCASAPWPSSSQPAYNFFNFVVMCAFWVTLVFFCVFLLGVADSMPHINWPFHVSSGLFIYVACKCFIKDNREM